MNPNLAMNPAPQMGAMASGSPTASPAKPTTETVPLAFLAQPDDEEQMQTPEKGDSGTMTVDYTIVDIQGDNAIIQPNAINGNDLPGGDDETTEDNDPDDQEGADLQSMAQQMSGGQGQGGQQ